MPKDIEEKSVWSILADKILGEKIKRE
jgi:hypothetical protein